MLLERRLVYLTYATRSSLKETPLTNTNYPTEGTWDQVSQIIGFAHTLIHQQGIARIQTDIRITTRYVESIIFVASVRGCSLLHYFVERTRFSQWKTMLLQWRGFYRRRLLNTWGIKRDVDIYWTGKLSVG